MIFKRNILNIGFLFLIVTLICFLSLPKEDFLMTDSALTNKPQIILDAGHERFSQYQKFKNFAQNATSHKPLFYAVYGLFSLIN